MPPSSERLTLGSVVDLILNSDAVDRAVALVASLVDPPPWLELASDELASPPLQSESLVASLVSLLSESIASEQADTVRKLSASISQT